MKANEDAHLSEERRNYLMAMTPLGASVLAAEKYAKALAAGQEQTNADNREQLVKNYPDGGNNSAMQQAGKFANKRDNTTPRGQDKTGQNARTGHYAAAIGDTRTRRQVARARANEVSGDIGAR